MCTEFFLTLWAGPDERDRERGREKECACACLCVCEVKENTLRWRGSLSWSFWNCSNRGPGSAPIVIPQPIHYQLAPSVQLSKTNPLLRVSQYLGSPAYSHIKHLNSQHQASLAVFMPTILVIRFLLIPSTWAVHFIPPGPLFYCSSLKSCSQKFLLLKEESDQLLLSSAAPAMASLLVKSHTAPCLCFLTHGLLPLRLFPHSPSPVQSWQDC